MRGQQAFGGIRVADAAAKLRRLVVGGRPEDTMALRTGDPARNPRRVAGADGGLLAVRRGVCVHGSSVPSFVVKPPGMGGDQSRDLGHRCDVLRVRNVDRVAGHLSKEGLVGILHDGGATFLADHP